jgi:DNA-binding CsgD family transcriptional regulator
MPDVVLGGSDLRPIERVVLKLHAAGQSPSDIGRRIGKKPGTVVRIMKMVEFKDDLAPGATAGSDPLRPVERVVVKLRARGESYGEIGNRIARSGRQVQMIESYADFKLGG